MELALADIRNEVEQLSSIEVDGVKYNITYYLGGDWKFLAIVTGIDSASCEYIHVSGASLSLVSDVTPVKWSVSDPTSGARTVAENIELSQLPRS